MKELYFNGNLLRVEEENKETFYLQDYTKELQLEDVEEMLKFIYTMKGNKRCATIVLPSFFYLNGLRETNTVLLKGNCCLEDSTGRKAWINFDTVHV